MPVSLRVPEEMLKRIARLAAAKDRSPHAFMLDAIEQKLDEAEAEAAFVAEAEQRLARMKKSGKAVPADQVFDYLRARARGEKARRPKAHKVT